MKKIFITLFTTILLIAITFAITKHVHADITSIQDLAAACNSAPVTDGLSQVTLSTSLTIQGQTAQITAPCEVHLTNGASIIMHNSQITTDKLAIVNDAPSNTPSTIKITNSSLTSAQGGLFMKLYHVNDTISIQHSTIDYPLSVVIVTTDLDGTQQAELFDMEASTVNSNGTNSEGIVLASTGQAIFVNNTFSTTSTGHVAILNAPICTMVNNKNAVPQCTLP